MLDFDEFIYKKDKKIMIKGKFYCLDVFFFFLKVGLEVFVNYKVVEVYIIM